MNFWHLLALVKIKVVLFQLLSIHKTDFLNEIINLRIPYYTLKHLCMRAYIPVHAELEIPVMHTSACIQTHAYTATYTFNSFASIAAAELGLRESSDRSPLAQLSHPD